MLEFLTVTYINVASVLFLGRRVLRYLQLFQQEQYIEDRFTRWILERRAFDRWGSIIIILTLVVSSLLATPGGYLSSLLIISGALALTLKAYLEEDPRTSGKIKLKMTDRARRIYHLAIALYSGVLILFNILAVNAFRESALPLWSLQIILIQAVPLIIIAANRILQPSEDSRQANFIKEAKEILAKQKPFVIGITGSYGKTSTKAVLAELMNAVLGPTFWPAKGINSPMGITREIREKLKGAYRYFVVEMAAFKQGSIKRLCDLVPPHAGIVTAVGLMHLERMGSEENIYQAKSELAQAVPEDGILVCNGDNAGTRRMAEQYRKKVTLLYGFDNSRGDLACWASDVRITAEGTHFVLHWQGAAHKAFIPLYGRPAVSNVLGSFAMCCTLGADPEFTIAALANLDSVDNRLQVAKGGGVTRLKDAYNSNPEGFKAALEVLKEVEGKRRILVTPGMIELGARQYEQNKNVAREAAGICDLVYIVGDTNRAALAEGLRDAGYSADKIVNFNDMKSALIHFEEQALEGDVLLIENDLPDLYEGVVNF